MTSWSRRISKTMVPTSKGLRHIIQKAGYVALPYRDCLAFDPELRPNEHAGSVGARLARAGLGNEHGMPQAEGEGAAMRFWWPEWRWDGGRDVAAGEAARAKDGVIPDGVQQHIGEAFVPEMRRFLKSLPSAFVESMEADGAATLTCVGLVIMLSHSPTLGWLMSVKTKHGVSTDDLRVFGLITIPRERWKHVAMGYWMAANATVHAESCDPRGS